MKGNLHVRFLGEGMRGNTPPLPDNLTSQFWANVYLNPLDQYVKRRLGCKGYVRYVDDLLLFADDKATLWEWHAAVTARLAELRLTAHSGAHPRPVGEGIPFLGFRIFPERMRLKRRKGIAFRRKFRRLLRQYAAGEIDLAAVDKSVQGWVNHARFGNTVGLRKGMLSREVILPPPPNDFRKQPVSSQ